MSEDKDLARRQDGQLAAATPINPDGKGLNGFLLDWYASEPRGVTAKPQRQVLAEFFTSMLVLSASFKYKPAVGTENYLYLIDGEWSLSLIHPDQWSGERREGFVGCCLLHEDMTWTITPSAQVQSKTRIQEALSRFLRGLRGQPRFRPHARGNPAVLRGRAALLPASVRQRAQPLDPRGRYLERRARAALPRLAARRCRDRVTGCLRLKRTRRPCARIRVPGAVSSAAGPEASNNVQRQALEPPHAEDSVCSTSTAP